MIDVHVDYAEPLSLFGRMLKPVARWVFRLLLGGSTIDIQKARKRLDFLGLMSGLPSGVARSRVQIPQEHGALAAEWLVPGKVAADSPVIFYLHGGGYISGSVCSHRDLAARLALAASARCLIIDYRLAPEHPFPAALEDSIAGWRWLLQQGIRPRKIIIAGDSAGGGLALATGLRLKQLGLCQPAGYYCLSPWTDLTLEGESHKSRQAREIVLSNPALLATAAAAYTAAQDAKQALVSPLFGELNGLAPLLIQVGTEEVLLDDALRFHRQACSADVNSQLKVWQGMWHVWPLFHRLGLPEARNALTEAAVFIQAQVSGNDASSTGSVAEAAG